MQRRESIITEIQKSQKEMVAIAASVSADAVKFQTFKAENLVYRNAGKAATKLGFLIPTRDFNYVKNMAAGFVVIAELDKTVGEKIISLHKGK